MTAAQDYFFMEDKENECFCFVLKSYWNENECIDDCLPDDFESLLPVRENTCWLNSMESTYELCNKAKKIEDVTIASREEAIQQLVEAGFEQVANPWESQ